MKKKIGIIALLALSCLAASYLLYYCCFKSKNIEIEEEVEGEDEDLSSPAAPLSLSEEQEQMNSIKDKWLEEVPQEKQRIVATKIVSPKLMHTVNQLALKISFHSIDDQATLILGRALEIKQIYRKTHYVFTHGQSLELSVANQCIKELVRTFTPRLFHRFNIPFRVPHTVPYSQNTEDFFTKHPVTSPNYQDNTHNGEMISVDAYFWNTDIGESALNFFIWGTNMNVHINPRKPFEIFKSIFLNYLPDETLCEALSKKACQIALNKKNEEKIGCLYLICVPKPLLQNPETNFAYRCHPFGRRCDCHASSTSIKILEKMQKDHPVCCKSQIVAGLTLGHAQYRLLTSRLTEESGVRTFSLNALTKNKRKIYRTQVKEIVKEAASYSRLNDLIETLTDDASLEPVIDAITTLTSDSQLDPACIQHLLDKKEIFL